MVKALSGRPADPTGNNTVTVSLKVTGAFAGTCGPSATGRHCFLEARSEFVNRGEACKRALYSSSCCSLCNLSLAARAAARRWSKESFLDELMLIACARSARGTGGPGGSGSMVAKNSKATEEEEEEEEEDRCEL